jgi:hypothetical protein
MKALETACPGTDTFADAMALRRIAMTLHRWHELECGDGNDFASWTIARGKKTCLKMSDGTIKRNFEYSDDGKPYLERHAHSENKPTYSLIADREKGALKRLAKIIARYPGLTSYIQGDPRGASLFILRPGDVRDGMTADCCYSNGIAVHK